MKLGRSFVHVVCCVSQVDVVIECIRGIVRVCGGVNEDVSIRIDFVGAFFCREYVVNSSKGNHLLEHNHQN